MGTKRTLESEDTPMSKESPNLHSFKRRRPRVSNPNPPASDSLSINRLKSKIRDTTRLLNHTEKIPAGARIEKERALVGYQHDLARAEEQAEKHKRRQVMIKKYHMVRFVERQKATRILKKTQKRLEVAEEGTAKHESLLVDVHNAEVDVNYILYHPLDERYQGLYPREQRNKASNDEEVEAERSEKEVVSKPRYWSLVEQCMQDENLEALREGKLARIPRNAKGKHIAPTSRRDGAAAKTASRKGKDRSVIGALPKKKEEKDESDGGFFEE